MMISQKERRAETAMRTVLGMGGMLVIGLFMAATPAAAQQCQNGSGTNALECGTGAVADGNLSTAVGNSAVAVEDQSSAFGFGASAEGDGATAIGKGAIASGDLGTALGLQATATATYSSAFGFDADASGLRSSAGGADSVASGEDATAFGYGAQAADDRSTAIGGGSIANINSSAMGYGSNAAASGGVAIGAWTAVTKVNATAVGYGASVDGQSSVALGSQASSDGSFSVAIGNGSYVSANNSVALGYGSVATAENQVSVGDVGSERRISNVADGTELTDAATVNQVVNVATALGNAITNNSSNIGVLEAEVNGHSVAITANTNAISVNSADIATLQGMIGLNGAELADINSQLATQAATQTAHTAMLNDHEQRIVALEQISLGTLARLDDEIDGSSAVAIAMSGNAFLPDTRFNLTGNLGAYNGAYAVSLQAGAMVRDNLAINAGVATGLNKRGKTGARVGFTIGW